MAALIGAAIACAAVATGQAEEPAGRGMTPAEWGVHRRTVPSLTPGPATSRGLIAAAVVSVTGSVRDQRGVPIVGALVFALAGNPPAAACPGAPPASPTPSPTPGGPSPITVALTRPDGSFALTLPAGRWYLTASQAGLLVGGEASRYVIVEPAGVAGVDLRLIDVPDRLTGTVRSPLGTPVAGGSVSVEGRRELAGGTVDYFAASARIDSTGTFSIPIVAGTWSLSTLAPDGALQAGRRDISITDTTSLPALDIERPAPTGAIAGFVVDGAGGPVPDAFLRGTLIPPATSSLTAYTTTRSAATGAFTLPVIAGEWAIEVAAPGYLRPAGLRLSGPDAGHRITVAAETGCIRGTLTLTNGTPALAGQIDATLPPAPGQGHGYSTGAVPDEQGRYTLRVSPGTWLLTAIFGPGLPSEERPVTVPPDATAVDFGLGITPTVTGTARPQIYLPAIRRAAQAGW